MGVCFFSDIRLVIVFIAQICVSISLASNNPLDPSCIKAARDSADLIGINIEDTHSIGVREDTLKYDAKKPLGTGSFHNAYETEFNGQPAVYVKGINTSNLNNLKPQEIQELAGMSTQEAEELLRRGAKTSTAFEKAQRQVASDLADVSYNSKIQGLTANGRPIASKIHTIVRDSNGVPTGYIMEKVPGIDMGTLSLDGKLRISDIISIRDQVLEQIKVLNSNGFQHGDLLLKNIMVDMSSGKPVARLIDFNLEHVFHNQKINSFSKSPAPLKSDTKTWLNSVYDSVKLIQHTDRLETLYPDLHYEFLPENNPLWSQGGVK